MLKYNTLLTVRGAKSSSYMGYAGLVRFVRCLHLADGINPLHPLAAQHLNLPQLRDNLFRLVSFDSHV
jgi:hypothetical protein